MTCRKNAGANAGLPFQFAAKPRLLLNPRFGVAELRRWARRRRALSSLLPANLLLGCIFIASGCASRHPSVEVPALWHASAFHPTVPDKLFSDYEAIFKYIAALEHLPHNRRTILGIAADSEVERSCRDPIGTLLVIRAEYYGQSRFGIRGAQGQGRYYAFQLEGSRWR